MNDKTKLVFLNSPNNPTGSVYPEKIIKEIVDIVGEYDACIVSDETYDGLMLDEGLKHESSIHCDELVSLHKSQLTHYIGCLSPAKLRLLNKSLGIAAGIN